MAPLSMAITRCEAPSRACVGRVVTYSCVTRSTTASNALRRCHRDPGEEVPKMASEPESEVVPLPGQGPGSMHAAGDPEEQGIWEHVEPREIDPATWERLERNAAEILTTL